MQPSPRIIRPPQPRIWMPGTTGQRMPALLSGLRRPTARGRRGQSSFGWSPAKLGSSVQWWTYDDDAAASLNTATNPYQFASVTNYGSIGGTLAQGTAADQPLLAKTGGRTSSYADGSCAMQASAAATDFKFLHDGTGCTIICLVDHLTSAAGVFASTVNSSTGFNLRSSGGAFTWRVYNAATPAVNLTTAVASYGPHILTIQFSSGTASIQLDDETPVTATPGALSSGDPDSSMVHYASTSSKTLPFTGSLPEIVAVNRILSAEEIAQTKAYLTSRWVADWSEVAGVPWPRFWLDATDTITVTVTGSGVSDWASKSGLAIVGKQTTDAKRPAYTSGQYVDCDGSDDSLNFTGLSMPADYRTVVSVVEPDTQGETFTFDASAGRFVTKPNHPSGVGVFDGAWRYAGTGQTGLQLLAYHLDSATVSTIRRDGASLGTIAYTTIAIGGTVAVGSNFTPAGSYYNGKIREYIIFQPALTLTQLQNVEAYLQAKHGTPALP